MEKNFEWSKIRVKRNQHHRKRTSERVSERAQNNRITERKSVNEFIAFIEIKKNGHRPRG